MFDDKTIQSLRDVIGKPKLKQVSEPRQIDPYVRELMDEFAKLWDEQKDVMIRTYGIESKIIEYNGKDMDQTAYIKSRLKEKLLSKTK